MTTDTEDELREANRSHDELMVKLRRDVARAYQHYAYLVRAEGDLHVEVKRFDDDSRTALNGGHVWTALVEAGRATQPGGLSGTYLEALLTDFDRMLTAPAAPRRGRRLRWRALPVERRGRRTGRASVRVLRRALTARRARP